ncbi:MAG: sugar phosphate isomerase/epimerase [Verrucomicrobiota bacterium]
MSTIEDRLSLSTCWCSSRHTDGYEMILEMVGLGFKRVELSHGIRISLVPGILNAVEEGIVEISSIHNFCPLPNSVQYAAPNLYQPSSPDARERGLWKRYTEQTLDFAVKLKTNHVVMHSGSTWFFFARPEKKLEQWIDESELEMIGLVENKDFVKRRNRTMKKIKSSSKGAMERIRTNYKEVIPYSKERGLTLCLENREGLEEMPLDSEHLDLLDAFEEPETVMAWHDTGHARLKELLGLLDHREYLEKIVDRLAGFHLHDVSNDGHDHQVPGRGSIDFDMIAEFVRPQHTLVLELSPKLSSDEVLASRDFMLDKLSR